MAVWEAALGEILPCHRVGGIIHDPCVLAIVENSDTPIDNDAPYSLKNFAVKDFANCPETTKFVKDSLYTVD